MKIIRPYRESDFGSALDLDGRGKCHKRRAANLTLISPNVDNGFYGYVAEDEYGDIVGFVVMEDLREEGNNHYMRQINASEKRRGIGRALVEKVFEVIGTDGHISLGVNTDNTEAISFYEALGFQRCGETKGYRRGQDKYWYKKLLS